jgi:hypothetical protein
MDTDKKTNNNPCSSVSSGGEKKIKKILALARPIPYRPIPLSGKTNATYYMLSTNYQESPVAQAKVTPR